jgi:hypothetical protein
MLILIEGDFELRNEDQAYLTVPADPNCPDRTQPGKTWIGQNTHGMCSCPSSSSIYTVSLTHLVTEAQKAMLARGGDILQAMQLVDHGLWDNSTMDPDSCGVIATFAPVGPWPQSEYLSPCSFPFAFALVSLMYCLRYYCTG